MGEIAALRSDPIHFPVPQPPSRSRVGLFATNPGDVIRAPASFATVERSHCQPGGVFAGVACSADGASSPDRTLLSVS